MSRVCVYYSSSYEPFQFFYLFTAVFSTPTAPVLAAFFVVGWTSDCVRWTFVLPLRGQNHLLLFRDVPCLHLPLCSSLSVVVNLFDATWRTAFPWLERVGQEPAVEYLKTTYFEEIASRRTLNVVQLGEPLPGQEGFLFAGFWSASK